MNFKQFCMTTLAVVAGIFITGVLSMFGMIYMMLQMILLNLGKEHPSTERQSILHIELSSGNSRERARHDNHATASRNREQLHIPKPIA